MINVGGSILAVLLFLIFAMVIGDVLLTANDPPTLADPPTTTGPQLFCGGVPVASTPASVSPATDTAAAKAPSTPPASPAPPSSAQSGQQQLPSCPAGQLTYGPQLRGALDVNARLTALLAVITPFLTTIIAFYFGQKAGTSDGKAQGQAALAQEISARAKTTPELQPLAAEFAQRGLAS